VDEATADRQEEHRQGEERSVLPVELFSDLVFVFAITQLTTVLVEDQTWLGLIHVLLLFGMIWWIYGGYIWLTNAVPPDRLPRQALLLCAMAGFLIMGLAIPHAFSGDGAVFGVGYLIVVLIHTGLFLQASGGDLAGIVRVSPFNILCAGLLIVAGFQSPGPEAALWAVALAIQVLPPLLARAEQRFRVEPGHFVERYSLLVLIALGESLLAVGAGGRNRPLSGTVLILSVLGLAVTAALWWAYFGQDASPEAALEAMPGEWRARRALLGYFYSQIPMMLGIVCVAAAVRTALPHPTASASIARALFLSGGVAGFLIGDLFFRTSLELPRSVWRLAALPLVLALVATGTAGSVMLQIGGVAAVLIAALAAEAVRQAGRALPARPRP
jgi:low temperature requirement protein LtrA